MGLIERTVKLIEDRRENVLKGNINCIPFPIQRFRNDFPGLEQGKYILVTGATKASKTQFATYTFIFHSLLYMYKNPDKVKLKIFYYPLEETAEEITLKYMSFLLYRIDNIRISPTDLQSTREDKVLDESILELVQKKEIYKKLLKLFEDCVVFSDNTNVVGMEKELKAYAEESGTTYYKEIEIKDDFGGKKTVKAFDYYVPKDPKEYKIIFIDHISLIQPTKDDDLRLAMSKVSNLMVKLKNRYKYSPIIIQQQAMFEQLDAFKLNKLTPSIATLADNKALARDCSVAFGIFSPYKYDLATWHNYDITKFKDNIRFVEVLLNRHGVCNGVLPLYFDGVVNTFEDCPLPTDITGLNNIYTKIEGLTKPKNPNKLFILISKVYDRITKNKE